MNKGLWCLLRVTGEKSDLEKFVASEIRNSTNNTENSLATYLRKNLPEDECTHYSIKEENEENYQGFVLNFLYEAPENYTDIVKILQSVSVKYPTLGFSNVQMELEGHLKYLDECQRFPERKVEDSSFFSVFSCKDGFTLNLDF